jgi:predicted transcriptional regulator
MCKRWDKWRSAERRETEKREANSWGVGVALEVEEAHNHIQVQREQLEQEVEEVHNHIQVQKEQLGQEVEEAHNHIQGVQVVKMMVHPYPDTSRQNKPHQSLPDLMASLRLDRQKRIL